MYKKNFITEVILRIDFETPLTELTSESLKKLRSVDILQQSDFKEQEVKLLEAKLAPAEQELRISTVGSKGTYKLNDGVSTFILDNGAFLLTADKYEQFDPFFDIFKKGYRALQDVVSVAKFKRIGLRFINRIEVDRLSGITAWKDYINPGLIPNYEGIALPNFSLRRNMNEIFLSDGEYVVHYRIGIWNKDFPSKIVDKEFIVDIDCYIDNVVLESDDILNKPPLMSQITYDSFKFIATSELIKLLEE